MKKLQVIIVMFLFALSSVVQVSFAQDNLAKGYIVISVYDINSTNNTATVSFLVQFVNFTSDLEEIHFLIASSGKPIDIRLNKIADGFFSGSTDKIEWSMAGYPENYPFDSYFMNFSLDLPYYYKGSEIYPSANFEGEKEKTLSSYWVTINNSKSLPLGIVVGKTEIIVDVIKRWQWGVPIMLPIWISFAFLGASFLIESKDLANHLLITTSIFVFGPIYFFTLNSSIPPRTLFSHEELQLLILMASTGIIGFSNIINSRIISIGRRLLVDTMTISILESVFIYVSLVMPFAFYHQDWIYFSWNIIVLLFLWYLLHRLS